MAKVIKANKYVDTASKREAAIARFVIESSAIEGVTVSEHELKAPSKSPQTATKRIETKPRKA